MNTYLQTAAACVPPFSTNWSDATMPAARLPRFNGILAKQAGDLLRLKRSLRTQSQVAAEIGIDPQYLSDFERGKVDWRRSDYRQAVISALNITAAELDSVGLEDAAPRASQLNAAQVAAREAAVRDFLTDLRPADYHPVFSSGAGGPFRDDEDPIEHIQIPNTISDRYPSAVYMRVDGDCLEPAIQRGVYAAILPDAALATAGSLVCVWFSDNGRKFAYLWESREDGDHVLVQTNPPETVYAPLGSVILGVVVDTYNAPAAPKLKARELVNIITKTAPHLLED